VKPLYLVALVLGACTSDPPSLLPANYAQTYTQMRPCRPSTDHDQHYVVVKADATAATAYTDRMEDFPVGSTVVKEEHDLDDDTCTGAIIEITLMQKLAPRSSIKTLDWTWQQLTPDNHVVNQDDKRCLNCHADCGGPPYGYAGTCSAP
jgi:hypothetical protein